MDRNSRDFISFLRWLVDHCGYSASAVVDTVEKPHNYTDLYEVYVEATRFIENENQLGRDDFDSNHPEFCTCPSSIMELGDHSIGCPEYMGTA